MAVTPSNLNRFS